MSFLRTVGQFLGSLIFSFALGFLILFIALANFTQYNNLQPLVTSFVEAQLTKNITQSQLDALYFNLTEQCKTSTAATVPLSNNPLSLKCEDVKTSSSSNISHLISKSIFNQTYYKKYDCNFVACIMQLNVENVNVQDTQSNQKFEIILSQKAYDFFSGNQIPLVVAIAVGIVLVAVSVRVWYKIFKIIGVTLLLVGITYFFIPLIKTVVGAKFVGADVTSVIDALFVSISGALTFCLIAGVALTAIGYISAYLLEKPKEKKT